MKRVRTIAHERAPSQRRSRTAAQWRESRSKPRQTTRLPPARSTAQRCPRASPLRSGAASVRRPSPQRRSLHDPRNCEHRQRGVAGGERYDDRGCDQRRGESQRKGERKGAEARNDSGKCAERNLNDERQSKRRRGDLQGYCEKVGGKDGRKRPPSVRAQRRLEGYANEALREAEQYQAIRSGKEEGPGKRQRPQAPESTRRHQYHAWRYSFDSDIIVDDPAPCVGGVVDQRRRHSNRAPEQELDEQRGDEGAAIEAKLRVGKARRNKHR